MSCVKTLKAALAAAPVDKPCTDEAVAVLFEAGYDASQQLSPKNPATPPAVDLTEACAQEGVPGACMPVLAWLAAGLRNSLSPDGIELAHEMACALLGVVSRVFSEGTLQKLEVPGGPGPRILHTVKRAVKQLAPFEKLCQQLATVTAALVAATFPENPAGNTTNAADSSIPSRTNPPLQQQASLAAAWERTVRLLVGLAAIEDKDAAAPLIRSTVFQTMVEGTLLLLQADPAAYPQALEQQQLLWDSLGFSMLTAAFLAGTLGGRVHMAWRSGTPSSWMRPLCKLQVLMLAKMQWDVRQRPDLMGTIRFTATWSAKTLTRTVTQLRSPCVAGDLLRQRAPGLVPHVRPSHDGQARDFMDTIRGCSPAHVGVYLIKLSDYYIAGGAGAQKQADVDALDLSLLLEVSELYCSIILRKSGAHVFLNDAWPVSMASVMCPADVLHAFAATSGDALISIAERLVEDVVYVMGSAASPVPPSGGGGSSRGSRPAGASSSALSSSPANGSGSTAVPQGAGLGSSAPPAATSSNNSMKQPWYGHANPAVTLEHRLAWAQAAVATLGTVSGRRQPASWQQGHEGTACGAVHTLIAGASNPRLLRLLETFLRVPRLCAAGQSHFMFLVPKTLPALHAVASSPEGSTALLSAITTMAKRQQVMNTVLAALVETKGQVRPAAAGVMAAVPGALGRVLAEQLVERPAVTVEQAYGLGEHLARLAEALLSRAAALMDPELSKAAAYVASKLPPGQDSKPWALEALLAGDSQGQGSTARPLHYKGLLAGNQQQALQTIEQLAAAVAQQHAALTRQQAAKLAQAAGGGTTEAEGLTRMLQGMWLGREAAGKDQEQQAGGSEQHKPSRGAHGSTTAPCSTSELPSIFKALCDAGLLQLEDVLAAGDPAPWAAAAADAVTPADMRVAATALLAACKAAGAVAQLPQLWEQVESTMKQQPWARELVNLPQGVRPDLPRLRNLCSSVARWAMLLGPLLEVLLPAEAPAQLREVAASVRRDKQGSPSVFSQLVGLLGRVAVPSMPGCSYPGCCNLEGHSEAELPVQVCSGCKGVRYCCRKHQAAHWKAGHKAICKVTQATVTMLLGPGVGAGGSEQMHTSDEVSE